MKEVMDQWTKMMEKMWSPWQRMMNDFSWPMKPEIPFQGKWSSWFAAMRSSYEINLSWWQTFMEQAEEMFFKMFKESPVHSQAVEQQLREFWEVMTKAQRTQTDIVKDQLQRMEKLLKEKEEAH
jgi:hypothetical protein